MHHLGARATNQFELFVVLATVGLFVGIAALVEVGRQLGIRRIRKGHEK
jgi:hypothetical protein